MTTELHSASGGGGVGGGGAPWWWWCRSGTLIVGGSPCIYTVVNQHPLLSSQQLLHARGQCEKPGVEVGEGMRNLCLLFSHIYRGEIGVIVLY